MSVILSTAWMDAEGMMNSRPTMDLALADVAVMLDVLCSKETDGTIEMVTIDSRQARPGALFIALPGPNFDGHDFVAEAVACGAVAAVVNHPVDVDVPCFVVEDCYVALGRLAAAWRCHCETPLVAITGSNGKTTVKDMLVAILSASGPVAATVGNFNNEIGVPLSLLSLRRNDRYAVIEMGANHPGEIDRLSRLARPDVVVINNAGTAHLAGFGNLKAVARAKGEIISGLSSQGHVIINHDDSCVGVWWELAADYEQIGFAIDADADVCAEDIDLRGLEGSRFMLTTATAATAVSLSLPGAHNVSNALAAASAALALGLELQEIATALAQVKGVGGRLQASELANGCLVIDDSYNANPHSLSVAMKVMIGCGRRRPWLVLGDMAELGVCSESFHVRAGHEARMQMLERVYAVGDLSRLAAEAFGDGGRHFPDQEALLAALSTDLLHTTADDVVILFKGSRSAGMEKVFHALSGMVNENSRTRDHDCRQRIGD